MRICIATKKLLFLKFLPGSKGGSRQRNFSKLPKHLTLVYNLKIVDANFDFLVFNTTRYLPIGENRGEGGLFSLENFKFKRRIGTQWKFKIYFLLERLAVVKVQDVSYLLRRSRGRCGIFSLYKTIWGYCLSWLVSKFRKIKRNSVSFYFTLIKSRKN